MSAAKANEIGGNLETAETGSDAQSSDWTNADVERQNVAVVQGAYEAVGRGDIPALLDLLAEDVEWTLQGPAMIPFAGPRYGRAGVSEFFSQVESTIEFLQFEPRTFVAQGDTIVVLGYEHNRMKPTGRTFQQEWAHVYTLRDGKIATGRFFEDTGAYVAALDAG